MPLYPYPHNTLAPAVPGEESAGPAPLTKNVWSVFQNILARPFQALAMEGRNFRDSRWGCGQTAGRSRATARGRFLFSILRLKSCVITFSAVPGQTEPGHGALGGIWFRVLQVVLFHFQQFKPSHPRFPEVGEHSTYYRKERAQLGRHSGAPSSGSATLTDPPGLEAPVSPSPG